MGKLGAREKGENDLAVRVDGGGGAGIRVKRIHTGRLY